MSMIRACASAALTSSLPATCFRDHRRRVGLFPAVILQRRSNLAQEFGISGRYGQEPDPLLVRFRLENGVVIDVGDDDGQARVIEPAADGQLQAVELAEPYIDQQEIRGDRIEQMPGFGI